MCSRKDHQAEVDKAKLVFGADQGASTTTTEEEEENGLGFGAKTTKAGQRVSVSARMCEKHYLCFIALLHR
jgi:hypothetical protein